MKLTGVATMILVLILSPGPLSAGEAPARNPQSDAAPAPAKTAPERQTDSSAESLLGPPVPDRIVEELQSRLAAPAGSPRSHSEEVRRLSAVMRTGGQIERDYPDAENLHLVRNAMLEAVRNLAVLEADEASQERLMELAKRIVSLPGPPEGKMWADFLLTRARLGRLDVGSPDASAEIHRFASSYADSRVTHLALMLAVDMATDAGDQKLAETMTRSLMKYRQEPAVAAFLRDRGVRLFEGYSLNASLKSLDGTTLRLPRDALGKVTVLHFWSVASRDIPYMRGFYDEYHDRGVEVIGINIDRDRQQVESFIRQQGLAWPQVFSGKGFDDPLLKRLGIPDVPFYWVIGWDGRVAVANNSAEQTPNDRPLKRMSDHVELQLDALTDLAQRVPYYRSGEFLARTNLLRPASAVAKSIPQAELEALEAKLLVSPWAGISQAQKAQSLKEALAAGQSLEQSHPAAANLALVQSWMLIAARWLAITTGSPAFADQSVAIAKRLLASNAPPASRLLADYVVTSAQLAGMEPQTKAGSRLIQDYADRYTADDAGWAATILAVMLTFEDGQDGIRQTLLGQLRTDMAKRADPPVYGFIRDCCEPDFPVWRHEIGPPLHVPPLRRMDGRELTLQEDLLGKVVILQFWSAACPPKAAMAEFYDKTLPYTGVASVPSADVVVVGINLDRNRADAEAFLRKSRYSDWIHTFSGLGWDDPTARACDILTLPRAIVLNRDGQIALAHQFSAESFHRQVSFIVSGPANRRGRK